MISKEADMASASQTTQASTAASKAEKEASLKDISVQIEALKADLANLTEAMGDYGKSRYRSTRKDVERRAKDARRSAEDGMEHLQNEAEYYSRQAQDMVREQPGTALGIAAAIGFLIGLFASRK
ncbi:DUF883 family protein [Histidinibacterium aquaticum]|uniref:DUF883 domain-containing protein n=1 Tax=Histidinibacterium aquaticum TaxID=2613962 RepID=A0A5J5GI74_9RHOB|nr:DUF883 family protein [Histidinibacterium aquaticum]KAA9007949.1 DUF883 domain-containing protein [Histidinibacterium aquaticum]